MSVSLCICSDTVMFVYSEAGVSPVTASDNNGGTTINEILHETAKYELALLCTSVFVDIS